MCWLLCGSITQQKNVKIIHLWPPLGSSFMWTVCLKAAGEFTSQILRALGSLIHRPSMKKLQGPQLSHRDRSDRQTVVRDSGDMNRVYSKLSLGLGVGLPSPLGHKLLLQPQDRMMLLAVQAPKRYLRNGRNTTLSVPMICARRNYASISSTEWAEQDGITVL